MRDRILFTPQEQLLYDSLIVAEKELKKLKALAKMLFDETA